MKKIIFISALILTTPSSADPHYVQALNPFIGEADYKRYLETFDEPFSVVTDSADLTSDGDSPIQDVVYIYIYRINQENIERFTLDIYCETGSANLDITMPFNSVITNAQLSWPLNPEEQKKVVLVYSTNAPENRNFYFNDEVNKPQVTLGPSCSDAYGLGD